MRLALGIVAVSVALAQTPLPSPFPVGVSGGGGSGTVTSVGLAGTANQITVTGTSPITSSGSWTLSFPTNVTLPGNTTGTFIGNLTGTASTATNALSLGGNLAATYAPLASPTFTGTVTIGASFLNVPRLASPTPSLTPAGADNGVTYSYFAVARSVYGPAVHGATATTTHGPTTLNGTDKINITAPSVTGAVNGCDIYRTVGGSDQGFIGNVACNGVTILADTGQVSTAPLPTTEDTSGAITNGLLASGVTHGTPQGVVSLSAYSGNPNLKRIQFGFGGTACNSSYEGDQSFVAIGLSVGQKLTYDNCGLVMLGDSAGGQMTHGNYDVVAIGDGTGIGSFDNHQIVAIGAGAMDRAGSGNSLLVAIGQQAFSDVGSNNTIITAIGAFAANGNNSGGTVGNSRIVAIGYQALKDLREGNNNIVAIGDESMGANNLNNAANDVAIGTATLQQCSACVGNVAIGDDSGFLVSTGTHNVLIGQETGKALTTESGNVMIGYQAGENATASNKLYIDNSNTATPLIGGDFSARTLTFTGAASATSWGTTTNCSSAASPAVCAAASAGSVALPTGVTSVALTVNTTAVTANSQITLAADDTLGTKLGITCNSTLATLVGGMAITNRVAGTSFEITYNGTIATNKLCVSYQIIN